MIEYIFMALGTIGLICFSTSAIPQAYRAFKDGHADGLVQGTLWLWFTGEVTTLAYTGYFHPDDYILILNYIFNILTISVIMRYKYFRRE